jgi:hypothetical protein
MLLTPKSVNETLNTKVQRCGRHQVNPVGGLDEGEKKCGDDEDGGKKWLVGRVLSDEATYRELNIEIKEEKNFNVNIPGANRVNIYLFYDHIISRNVYEEY